MAISDLYTILDSKKFLTLNSQSVTSFLIWDRPNQEKHIILPHFKGILQ
jgi:hypothetical protein